MVTHDLSASVKVKTNKIVISLNIPSGTSGNSANSSSGHGVIMVLMCLNIVVTELNFAVFVKINLAVKNQFWGTLSVRNTALYHKHVTPEHTGIRHFHNEYWWKVMGAYCMCSVLCP